MFPAITYSSLLKNGILQNGVWVQFFSLYLLNLHFVLLINDWKAKDEIEYYQNFFFIEALMLIICQQNRLMNNSEIWLKLPTSTIQFDFRVLCKRTTSASFRRPLFWKYLLANRFAWNFKTKVFFKKNQSNDQFPLKDFFLKDQVFRCA